MFSFCVKLHNIISQTPVQNQVCDLCAEYWMTFLCLHVLKDQFGQLIQAFYITYCMMCQILGEQWYFFFAVEIDFHAFRTDYIAFSLQ